MPDILGNQGISPKQFRTNSTPSLTVADGLVATLTPGQTLVVQNMAAAAVFIRLGAAATAASVYTYCLPACALADDGTSPPVYIDNWIGTVYVAKASGTTRVMATVLDN